MIAFKPTNKGLNFLPRVKERRQSRSITSAGERTIVRAYVFRQASIIDICRKYGYTWKGVSGVLDKHQIKRRNSPKVKVRKIHRRKFRFFRRRKAQAISPDEEARKKIATAFLQKSLGVP